MDSSQINEAAEMLITAEDTLRPCSPISVKYHYLTVDDAKQIQKRIISHKISRGKKIVGWKVGGTARWLMEAPGYTGPELSPLLDAGMLRNGDPVSLGKYLTPYIGGPELAFIISEDLTGPGVTTARVLQSLAGVIPAIELCDSRMGLPFPTTADVIADQGGAAGVLLHSRLTPITDIDVRTVGLVVEKNGRLIDTGAGAEAFGNPIEVVAWLANSLAKYNERLVAGQFVITGELVPTIDLKAGDVVTAHFDRLGILSIAFIK